ncbi:phytanoyl-CoA dioxygenase family protein [Pseudoroseomonas globiformis]|uniref:Phytanoyl-CoA dioxygenase family protein n=1 Tax=Teichococcus globiformis TaxID=2307229 RepID=A0ABV7G4K3_9PROT
MQVITPIDTTIDIPNTLAEDRAYFTPDQVSDAVAYYGREGYVVIRGLLPSGLCDAIRAGYNTEIRQSCTPILRQKNMRYEINKFDADGFLANPIFNVQDLESRRFGNFKRHALQGVTQERVAALTSALIGINRTKLIQTMFFEAPAGTWAHQDSYYQDSAVALGRCVAGWYALEDVDARAGRFYVCPRSHRSISVMRNAGEWDFATGHDRYRQAVLETMRKHEMELRAPYLAKGDVIFWNSLTVHGSFTASGRGVSRASLTAHYLPEEDDMLQFHTRIRHQKMTTVNGMPVAQLHDQDMMRNRLVRGIAAHAPGPYAVARKLAMQAMFLAGRFRRSAAGVQAGAVLPAK